jgi:arabinogalactan endo-1,4-beta-galactosidase
MNTVIGQTHIAGARDIAVQKLRDLTIAVAVAAAAGVGVFAWISAATNPGSTGTSSPTGNAARERDGQSFSETDDGFGFAQAPPARTRVGPGVAASGGSHP